MAGLLWICGLEFPLPAAESGSNVVIVFNSRMPESREVAEHYARRRQVPTNQVFGFHLPIGESMSRADYLDQLQQPLLQRLDADKLFVFESTAKDGRRLARARIRYVALCYGVPTKIEPDPELREPGLDQVRVELRRNEASVDSQLACLPVAVGQFRWSGPWLNPLYGATNSSQLHPTNGILLVTRLDGPSAAIARGLVDKALAAEADGLWGRAYFDAGWGKNNTNYLLGDRWILGAAELCRRLGFETEIEEAPATFPASPPLSQVAFYAGWYANHVEGPFAWGGVEFVPGAFAYHLNSFNAVTIRSTNRQWVGPLLALGATATLGSVHEPYLGLTPDLSVFFTRFLVGGFSFGEAAWASQNALSWQNIAIGDPLYRPFAKRPEQRIADLERRQSKLLEWYHLMIVNMNLASSGDADRAIASLERLPLTRRSAVLREKLGDLFWSQKKLSFALDAYEAALKLEPTPMQKLRLLLRLAERSALYGRHERAFDLYQQVLADYPNYLDRLAIYQSLLPLARKLEKPEDIEACQREIKRLSPPPTPP